MTRLKNKKYLEIYEKIKNDMMCGALKKGNKLPSKRVMSESANVSVITVEHAYDLLVSEGYADSRERSGYFVTYSKGEFFTESRPSSPAPSNVSQTESEGISFDRLAKTTRAVLSEYGEKLLARSENKGLIELRNEIRNYLERNKGVLVDTERIVIGSGAEYLYGLIIDLLGERKYAIETPSYTQIENIYKARNIDLTRLKIGADGIPSDTLINTSADVLHITPFRSYPTGVCANANKKAEYLLWAKKNSAFIIEDDYESEFSLQGNVSQTLFAMDTNDSVIYVNTFSKTVARSLRVGYMILPKRLVPLFDEKLGFYSCTVPTLEQYIITYLLKNGTFEKHLNKIRRIRRLSARKS